MTRLSLIRLSELESSRACCLGGDCEGDGVLSQHSSLACLPRIVSDFVISIDCPISLVLPSCRLVWICSRPKDRSPDPAPEQLSFDLLITDQYVRSNSDFSGERDPGSALAPRSVNSSDMVQSIREVMIGVMNTFE